MKKLLLALIGSGLVFSVTGFAANLNVGVVNFQQVLASSPSVAAASKNLKKQFQPQQDKLVAQQKQLKASMDKLKKDGSVMQAQDKKNLQDQIGKQQAALYQMSQQYQQKVMQAQQAQMKKIIDRLDNIVTKIAHQKNLDLVLAKNTIAYAKPDLDITQDVIKAAK